MMTAFYFGLFLGLVLLWAGGLDVVDGQRAWLVWWWKFQVIILKDSLGIRVEYLG